MILNGDHLQILARFGHHPVPQEAYQGMEMLVTDGTTATGSAEVLFEFLDQVIPIQHQPYPRMPGKESHDRILQAFITIGEYMKPPAE